MTEQKFIAIMATKVMGWKNHGGWWDTGEALIEKSTWNPRRNIADAYMIAKKFEHYKIQSCVNGEIYCELMYGRRLYGAHGKTDEEAICNAAMKVVASRLNDICLV
jgi:hypothetical protein